jgi:hypothetical protein
VLYGGLPTLALITANRPPWVLAACASPGLLNDLRPLWDRQRRSFADSLAGSIVVRHRH